MGGLQRSRRSSEFSGDTEDDFCYQKLCEVPYGISRSPDSDKDGINDDIEFILGPPKPPTAYFEATLNKGAWPLTVGFVENSSGLIDSYLWEFADGQQSTARDPSHIFYIPGTYPVSLTVTGPGGKSTYQANVIVEPLPNGIECGDTKGLIKRDPNCDQHARGRWCDYHQPESQNHLGCSYALPQSYNLYYDPSVGTNTATGLPAITRPIFINGHGSTISRSISAPSFRIFYVYYTGDLRLSNLIVANGRVSGSGGGILNTGSLSLFETTIRDNSASNGGGGLSNLVLYSSATAVVSRSTISDNDAFFLGSGTYNGSGASMTIVDSTVSGKNWLRWWHL